MHSQDPSSHGAAPEFIVEQWLNTDAPLTLSGLRGKVVVIEAFQMLCPGCVAHGLPQAARVRAAFPSSAVEVIGLHTVFEHHDAMTPVSLRAFLHEYRIAYPVGVDLHHDGIPHTMRAYGMRGTPTLIVIDQAGLIRGHWFGQVADLTVGALIGDLLCGARSGPVGRSAAVRDTPRTADGCGDACEVMAG